MPTVKEVMTSEIVTVEPDASIQEAARRMRDRENPVRRIPATTGGRPVGVVPRGYLREGRMGPLAWIGASPGPPAEGVIHVGVAWDRWRG